MITTSSGSFFLSRRTACCTAPLGEAASEPVSSLRVGSPKSRTAGTPASKAALASSTSRSADRRETPGMASTSWRTRLPGATNMG